MKLFYKIGTYMIIFALLLSYVPANIIVGEFNPIKETKASVLLSREAAKKFEGNIAAGYRNTSYIRADGTVASTGYNGSGQINTGDWNDIVKVAPGFYHTVGLKSNGTVVATGHNPDGRTELTGWTNIVDIAAGDGFSVGLTRDGSIVAAGEESSFRANFSDANGITAIAAGMEHTVGLKNDGTVVAAGDYSFGQANVTDWKDIASVVAGGYHTVGLKKDGTVVAAGDNRFGQLDVNEWTDIVSISTSSTVTLGLKSDGTVVAAGFDGYSQKAVSDWNNIVAISAGYEHVIGLKSDGTILTAGYSDFGQRAVNDWNDIKSISAAGFQTVGLKTDGTVVGTGNNDYGQLNISGWSGIKAVAAGFHHTVGLKEDGTVVATGMNSSGQLNVGEWKDIVAVVAGIQYTAGLKSDGTVVATGYDFQGLISDVGYWSDIVALYGGESHIFGIKSDGTVIGSGTNQEGGQKNVGNWTNIVAVATGNSHTVGLKDDGTLVFVGYDSYGLISDAREWTNIIAISACRDHQVGLKNDGTVVANGDFTDGAKNISQWKDIVAISSGYNHVVGLKRDGTVVATRNIPDDQILSTENISVNKKVVKPNDLVNIDLRNNGLYTIQDNQFQLMNGDTVLFDGQMTIDGETDRAISYTVKPSDIGNITLKFPGVYDLFGNPVTKQNAFQVIPLQSLVSSKIQTKSGDKITLTATFYQSVKPDFTVELSGGADLQATQMNEVVGSNGTKFTLDYTVPSNYVEGQVDAAVQNVTTADGTVYGSYTENAVFAKTNNPLPIQSLTASKTLGKIGDKITITADFSESVKPGVQITLVGENFTLPSATMTEVTGSNGKKYIYTYPVVVNVNGPISAHITNAYDQNGSLYGEYQHSNLFVSDGMPPYVKGMSASATTGKLGDKVVITATFSEPIKPIVKLSFYYGAVLSPTVMKEVPGTNQTQYSYEYTIDQYATGPVYADIRDVEDLAGNKYPGINRDGRYFTFNLFNPDGVKPTVQTFSSDKNIYEAGDVASFTATLSEPVKSGVKIKLSGAINEEYEMTQVDGKTYEFYYVIPNDLFGNVNVELLNIEDLVGNTNQYSKSNAFFISDPTNAKLSAISIKSGTVTYPLSPSFSPEVYEYRTTVPSIVSSINVGAITEDLNASVTGLGTVNVKLGDNVILLTSTSKDGTKKTYKLIVTVKDIAPTNVKASSNSYNSVKLTWSAVSGASGYEIYRSTSSTGTFSKIASTASTAYINTSVNTGTTYYYKVRAYKTGTTTKYSKFSSVVSAKPIPATPSSVKAASSSYNSIKTSWAAVAGASGYEVYRATSSTGTYSRIGTTTATSYNNTGLTTNKSYFYKVRAYRTVGTTKVYSNYSSVVSAKPIPSVPTNFKATRVSSTSLKLTWSSVSGASGYEIYRATSSTGTYSLLKSTASLYYTNSSLTTGKTYFYKARAYRMVGTTKVYSGWTTVISARP